MAPFDVVQIFGKAVGYLVFLLIGMGFGAALELSGFGDSRVLAGQFYFREMRVLKVMFTAIITAMLLIFLFSGLGLMDFEKVWVNTTFLWSQIAGGLIMGAGFIIGGFCPGTSLVSASTLKIDGAFFFLGVFAGVWVFGETVSLFDGFYNSGDMGRFMLPELFGIRTGVTVFLIIIMALVMFYGAEISEKYFGGRMSFAEIGLDPRRHMNFIASGALVLVAAAVMIIGQPGPEEKWNMMGAKERGALEKREVYIHPGELLEIMNDFQLYVRVIDVRGESDYNAFHIERAVRATFDEISKPQFVRDLQNAGPGTITVLAGSGEAGSTRAYKILRAQGVSNLYVLSGGMNAWLDVFGIDEKVAKKITPRTGDAMRYAFLKSVGSTVSAANPVGKVKLDFERKVRIQKKSAKTGGCG